VKRYGPLFFFTLLILLSLAVIITAREGSGTEGNVTLESLITRYTPSNGRGAGVLELQTFEKMKEPIMKPRDNGFDSRKIYNMAVIRENGITSMLYRGEDRSEPAGACTGRIGLATSRDGITFTREEKPVLVPEEEYEKCGIEDPRLVKIGGTLYLTYTGYDGKKARLCLATSNDLRKWKKLGPLFPSFPVTENWTKSGAILPERIRSGALRGKYVMYFGDTNIWMATSDDLLHWQALPEPVIRPRKDAFDSTLVEPGPPPFFTKEGILMIYNSAGNGVYHVGAALFDSSDPGRLLARTDRPLMSPTAGWEKAGYVNNVVFAEGLTVHGSSVYLYYGGSDRYIGLAIADCRKSKGTHK